MFVHYYDWHISAAALATEFSHALGPLVLLLTGSHIFDVLARRISDRCFLFVDDSRREGAYNHFADSSMRILKEAKLIFEVKRLQEDSEFCEDFAEGLLTSAHNLP